MTLLKSGKLSKSTNSMLCPYCGEKVDLVNGRKIYPHRPDLENKMFYLCQPCNAYVGCHPRSTKPLGYLADSNLRKLRSYAHEFFDPLWKNKIFKTRTKAYKWLSQGLGIPQEETHIAMFNEKQCNDVIKLVMEYRKSLKYGK